MFPWLCDLILNHIKICKYFFMSCNLPATLTCLNVWSVRDAAPGYREAEWGKGLAQMELITLWIMSWLQLIQKREHGLPAILLVDAISNFLSFSLTFPFRTSLCRHFPLLTCFSPTTSAMMFFPPFSFSVSPRQPVPLNQLEGGESWAHPLSHMQEEHFGPWAAQRALPDTL